MLKKILKIYKKYDEIINYLIFGGLTTVVSVLSYTLFTRLFSINYLVSNVISWIISVTFAYVTNKFFVFKTKEKNVIKESLMFYLSRIGSLLIESLMMYILVDLLCYNDLICKVIAQIIVILFNYIFSKLIVFKKNN